MQNETYLSELRKFMTTVVPFWQTLGLELKEIAPGKAVFEVAALPGLMQNGIVHGGVLASIADSACAVAAISLVFPDRYATTINLQLSYIKPVNAGRVRAEGRCLKAGKNILFCDAELFDEKEALVCTATSQLLAVPAKGDKTDAP
jgi:uncharacterized protein (TIGR00369 family)